MREHCLVAGGVFLVMFLVSNARQTIEQACRLALVSGSLDDSCLQGCRAAEWLKPVCFIQFWTSTCAEPAEAFIFANSPVRQNFNYRKCIKWLDWWQIAQLFILLCSIFHIQDTKRKALNYPVRLLGSCLLTPSNYDWCVSLAYFWPMTLWWEFSCHDTVRRFSIITNLSLFSQVLGCISQFSFIVLCKTGSCFMVQQREIVWCPV